MAELRALTVQQPYAWAIAYGGKTVENRTRPLAYRGPLAIHAGLGMHGGHFPVQTPEGRAAAEALDALGGRACCWEARYARQPLPKGMFPPGLALGAVIALAEVTGCHWWEDCWHPETEKLCSPWAMFGQYHITLAGPRPLTQPVPCRGMLGLWRLPEDVEKAVREQLEVGRCAH